MTTPFTPLPELPTGWTCRIPEREDVPEVVALVTAHRRWVGSGPAPDPETVATHVAGTGSWTRRQLVVADRDDRLVAWVWVQDRAAGRTIVDLTVAPDAAAADLLAESLLSWAELAASDVARLRDLATTQLDATVLAEDPRQQQWLAQAGYRRTRTWLQMTRRVDDAPALEVRPGVHIRRVAKHEDGMPLGTDLQIVHHVLEESFADHFNSYRESFSEFVQRLREDPGHRWDHWWIAEVDEDDERLPAGALVSSVDAEDHHGVRGSHIDYIGVHRRARGRGVAKSLLVTVIHDAHERGRNRVDLEVDADSPTGADGLYRALGWTTAYRTESWHADLRVT